MTLSPDPFTGTALGILAQVGSDWLKSRKGRIAAAVWIREELVHNATTLQGVLLEGWENAELSRARYDSLGVAFANQRGETGQLSTALKEVYQYVNRQVMGRLALAAQDRAEAEAFNKLAVQINGRIRLIDSWLGYSPDRQNLLDTGYRSWEELIREAGASALSFEEAWGSFSKSLTDGTAALVRITVEERNQLADNPLREHESYERWHAQYQQGFAVMVADEIYELRVDDRRRLLFSFEDKPGPVIVLSLIELSPFLAPGWIPAGAVGQAVHRRQSWQYR